MLPKPPNSDAEIVNSGPKLDRYTARPNTATAMARYIGNLFGPPGADPTSGALPNCCVGAENWVVGCCAGGYPGLPGGPDG
ncbi:hypothetical protein MCEL_42160 [Mycolicibacterium celeriflavum]|uniref:Uncharacterized protein n=1 Tax=Mycolicibacterium celeriflavum TaxID=1249101 RepID=A0A7I7RP09_MYCCF|nr:hypothetical protein MCEL_42160 [Mycolicibacterium celeriflavum]